MTAEKIVLNEERNVSLTAYVQETDGEFGFSKRPAILVLPGGGYAMCSDREADAVALSFSKAGYQTFILRYTVKSKGKWPLPLEDYEQAMAMILDRAEEWHIDPNKIAVVGFSAGGHLAACAATLAIHRPAAAILVYPAILKEIVDLCQPGMPYPNEHVTRETCPCFLVACRDDSIVDIRNTLMMEYALAEKKIPFESHIYSYGGHGFSTAESWIIANSVSDRVSHWVQDSIGWLNETLGRLTRKGFTEPNSAVSKDGDSAPVLSIQCTFGHLRKQSEDVQALLKPVFDGVRAIAKERGFSEEALYAGIANNRLRELMELLQMDDSMVASMDRSLHSVVNRLD